MKQFWIVIFCLLRITVSAQKTGQALIDSVVHIYPSIRQDTEQIKALSLIAQTYLQFDPSQGFPYTDTALLLAEKLHWKKGMARIINLKGLLTGDTGNSKQARVYFEQSMALQKEINNTSGVITSLNNIGRAYQRESNFGQALENYLTAFSLAEKIKDNSQIALVGTNLTAIYFSQMNFEKSEEYGQLTLKYGELSGTKNNIAKALQLLGTIRLQKKDTAAAKSYFEKSLKLYEEMGNPMGVAALFSELGIVHASNPEEAIMYSLKAQAIFDKIGANTYNSVTNLANLGNNYFAMAKSSHTAFKKSWLDSASYYLQRSMVVCKASGNTQYLANVYVSLSDLEEYKGNYSLALDNLKKYNFINDSLFSQTHKNELAGMENKYNMDLKNKEIALKQVELVSQRKTQVGLLIGLSLLGVIGVLLYWQNRVRKKSNTTLMVLNNQLDEANKVKARFFGILSHDLRSPISSLINFLTLLKNEPEEVSSEDRQIYQQVIGQSTENLLQTMETMLLWSKEQMDNFKPDIRIVSVNTLFDYIQKFFLHTSQVQMNFSDPGDLQVSADENYLKVIMQNLTSNAIKALKNKPEGIITWKAKKEGTKTILSISDNGPGLNAEQMKVLYHDEASVNAKTGFGFHMIRDLAKAIQYKISVESQPGMGTTFMLSS
jgi:signal transduction histidine kinase